VAHDDVVMRPSARAEYFREGRFRGRQIAHCVTAGQWGLSGAGLGGSAAVAPDGDTSQQYGKSTVEGNRATETQIIPCGRNAVNCVKSQMQDVPELGGPPTGFEQLAERKEKTFSNGR